MVSDTSARPNGGREEVPAKITSTIEPPRRVFAPCSPITHASASTTFDLPDPLGPTTQVIPGSKFRVVAEAKDLNPRRVSVLRYTRVSLAKRARPPQRDGALSSGWEPQSDLPGGGLFGVRAVNEVFHHAGVPCAGEIPADGAWRRGGGVGCPSQRTEACDDLFALDDRGHQRAGVHEFHQRCEEGLALVLGVVLCQQRLVGVTQLQRGDGVSLGFDAAQDFADEATADAVGFDEDEGALGTHAA